MSPAACDGLRVLDLSQGMCGPLATMILADHGADVRKVEPPWGDWARELPGFAMWNRGKVGCTLDLRSPADLRSAQQLAEDADVVVHDWHAGTAAARGLDGVTLRRGNPAVVTCAISAAPANRPQLCTTGYDATVAALAGRMVGLDPLSGAVPGQDRDAPVFTAAPTAAYGAAMLAVQGILGALHQRASTGIGIDVSTSLVQAEAAFLMRQDLARGGPDRPGLPGTPPAVHRGIVLSFLTAQCRDDRYIQMCARQDHHFRNWMRALDLDDVMADPRYVAAPLGIRTIADIEELEARIRQRMLEKTQAEWMELFSGTFDVGADPFLTPEEFLAHPQMLANDRVVTVTDPHRGKLRQPGPLVLMSATPARIERPAPGPQAAGPQAAAALPQWLERHHGESGRTVATVEGLPRATGPLSGVTIVEIAYFVAGPLSATLLAEQGARVIKVEPLDGDPSRRTGLQNAKFLAGKESIALDLKSESGHAILTRLLESSDALVHNFRPGVPERLGFGYDDVARINPGLVYLYAASYGSRGPQAHRTAFHSTPNALCGGGILQAGEGNPPVDDSYCDPGSGLAAATALLLGLAARRCTGRGQYLETSMLSSAAYVHSNDLVLGPDRGQRTVVDHGQHGFGACYRLYRCHRGWVFLSAWRDRDFRRFAQALGRTDWLDDPATATRAGREAAAGHLADQLAKIFAERDAAAWCASLDLPANLLVEVSNVPLERWFEQQDLLLPMDHPEFGPYWQPPTKMSFGQDHGGGAPTCSLGEHTVGILAELGYTDRQIAELRAAGAVSFPAT